jgi:TolB-like protein/Tfp pilus assembly protein PilF
MASLIPGFEYDIFISYRQKDNKYDGWVTEFVTNLKKELEATFKEEISVYFDINPHDGLLETHDVDASLKNKLKCLIFIPVISRTYCDPKSFAWEHEFMAFVELASEDQYGLKVQLPNGNVASRVLPVRIHDLDKDDIKLCESVLGAVLRGVEFIYKEPGVNKPLTADDDEKRNLNNTKYRIQINKIANAINELVSGLKSGPVTSGRQLIEEAPGKSDKEEKRILDKRPGKVSKFKWISRFIIAAVLVIVATLIYPKIFSGDPVKRLEFSGDRIAIAVMPFQNLTNDTIWNVWQEGIQESLISSLSNVSELKVRQKKSINDLIAKSSQTNFAALTPSGANKISQKLEANLFMFGSIQQAGPRIRLNAQLIDTKTNEILKSFEINGPYKEEMIFNITDSLRKKVIDYLLMTKLLKENPIYQHYTSIIHFTSPVAFRYFIYGQNASDGATAASWYLKSLEIDSNNIAVMSTLYGVYTMSVSREEGLKMLLKIYKKKDQGSILDQLWANYIYASEFKPPEEAIQYLRQMLQIDDQQPDVYHQLGYIYMDKMKQYDKAIPVLEKGLEICQKWDDNNIWYYLLLGGAYHNTGQYNEEKELFSKAEKLFPDNPPLIRMQACLALTQKDTVAANNYIKKFITLSKNNSQPETNITISLAVMYQEAGMLDKAEELYRKAISSAPERLDLLWGFSEFLIDNNRDLAEVSEFMDKIIRSSDDKLVQIGAMDTKGRALCKQGKYKEALAIMEEMWKSIPYPIYEQYSHLVEVRKAAAGQKNNLN